MLLSSNTKMGTQRRKRRTKEQLLGALKSQIDMRTERGRAAFKKAEYYASKNSPTLGLIDDLLSISAGRDFLEFLDSVDVMDYITNVKGRCICGNAVHKELYLMGSKGHGRKEGPEGQIYGRIKDKTPMSELGKTTRTPFHLGSTHYDHFENLLSDLGLKKGHRTKKKARKMLPRLLKKDCDRMSPYLSARLMRMGLDPSQISLLRSALADASDLSDESMLYETDKGKKNSLGNWFREKIDNKEITDPEIIMIYEKLDKNPQLVTPEERAALITYSYEHRYYDRRAVIDGVKKDLEYLASLSDDDPFAKRFSKPDLERHFVRPGTRFRKREGLKNLTIAELLEQSHLTFIEAIGLREEIRDCYHDMDDVRLAANRETAQQYGLGRMWDYLLKELRPLFLKMKGELHEEFEKAGEVYGDHVLTQEEYRLLKTFYKRAGIGKGSERENYLRRFSIGSFREVAPKVIAIGRKVRFARKKYEQTGDEWLKRGMIKEECMLREDFERRFKEFSGIDENIDAKTLIDMLSSADENSFVNNSNFLKFREEHGKLIGEMYDSGIVARKYLSQTGKSKQSAIRRYHDILKKEDVRELGDEDRTRLEGIKSITASRFIEYMREGSWIKAGQRFMSKKGRDTLLITSNSLERMMKYSGYDPSREKEYEECARVIKNNEGNVLLSESEWKEKAIWEQKVPSELYKSEYGDFRAINFKGLEELADSLRDSEALGDDFFEKLKEMSEGRYGEYFGLEDARDCWYMKKEKRDTEILGTRGLVSSIRDMHSKMEKMRRMAPEDRAAELRRGIWEHADRRKKYGMAMYLKERITEMISNDPALRTAIRALAGRCSASGNRDYSSDKIESYDVSRFMGDGKEFRSFDWYDLASGKTARFYLHSAIRVRLNHDRSRELLPKATYYMYSSKLDDFEKKVNEEIIKDYRT